MSTDKTKTENSAVSGDLDAGKVGNAENATSATNGDTANAADMPAELNGPKGPEPTRYGDWEQKGRCSDF